MPLIASATKVVVFSDFDGTITLNDSNDYLTDNLGYGVQKRLDLNEAVLNGSRTFRDIFSDMLDSVHTPFPECIQTLTENVHLDPGFAAFYDWTLKAGVPVIILSSGMEPIIRALLSKLIGPKAQAIPIVSNNVDIHPDGRWNIVFRDESHFGHDKSRAIKPYAALPADGRPILVYCGDGVSDISAARETDLLFAKKGRDLVLHCLQENVPFYPFDTFAEINAVVADLETGRKTIPQVVNEGRLLAQNLGLGSVK